MTFEVGQTVRLLNSVNGAALARVLFVDERYRTLRVAVGMVNRTVAFWEVAPI